MEFLKAINKIKSPEFWNKVEFNRYGTLFNIVIFQSCLASISVAFVCQNLSVDDQTIPLILLSVSTLAANGANIAQGPMKWILGLGALVVVVSIGTLIYAVAA